MDVVVESVDFLPLLKPFLGRKEGVVGRGREGGSE
jgi:hypothetical protein